MAQERWDQAQGQDPEGKGQGRQGFPGSHRRQLNIQAGVVHRIVTSGGDRQPAKKGTVNQQQEIHGR